MQATPTIVWEKTTAIPALVENEIIIWAACLRTALPRLHTLAALLSSGEQQRAKRLINLQHRQRFIAARGILREILGHYLQVLPEQVAFAYQPYGKPALQPTGDPPLFFNVSHSHDLALYALCRNKALGVDVERVRTDTSLQAIAARFFAATEYQALAQLPVDQQPLAFFKVWSQKEAFIKARGEGLHYPLAKFTVNCLPNQPAAINQIDGDEATAQQWALFELQPAPDYVGAVAVTKPVKRLILARWNQRSVQPTKK